MSSRPEDTFFNFLSRLRQAELAVRDAYGVGTLDSRPYSSIQKRYFRKFLGSQDMLYFTTLWYFNTWRPCERRGCPYLIMLSLLVKSMSAPERRKYFRPLMDTFLVLINDDHIIALNNFLQFNEAMPKHLDVIPTFLDIFRILNPQGQRDAYFYHEDAPELCTQVIIECAESLEVNLYSLLTLMPYRDLDFILSSYSIQRHHLFFYRESDILLMDLIKGKKNAKTLLRHGFRYFLHAKYYKYCITNLLKNSIKVDGKYLGEEFKPEIANKYRLRLQMAIELLHALFTDMPRRDKKIISMIWKAVPYPFITEQEMFQMLEPFFLGHNIQLKDLCAIYARYNNIFPVPAVKTPRSLKHLSRIQVRENLFRAHSLCDQNILLCLRISYKLYRYVWELSTF